MHQRLRPKLRPLTVESANLPRIAKSRIVTKSSQTTKQLDFRRQIGVINPHQKSVEINEAQLLKVKVLSKRVNSLKK